MNDRSCRVVPPAAVEEHVRFAVTRKECLRERTSNARRTDVSHVFLAHGEVVTSRNLKLIIRGIADRNASQKRKPYILYATYNFEKWNAFPSKSVLGHH